MAMVRTSKGRLLAFLGCLSLVLAVSACDLLDEDLDPSPLDAGFTDSGLTCLAPSRSKDFTFGSNVLHYRGKEPLTITDVEVIRASDPSARPSGAPSQEFTMVEAFVVPVRTGPVGSWSRWTPPAHAVLSGSRPAVGATMSANGVTEYNLVVHLTRKDASRPVVASSLRIFHTIGETEWGSVATWSLGVSSLTGAC